MQFLNKIATAFNVDEFVTRLSPKPQLPEQLPLKSVDNIIRKPPPKPEMSGEDVQGNPKYKVYFDKLEKYKIQYEDVQNELKHMEQERKKVYKQLYDSLNGQITANFNSHPTLGREIYKHNNKFKKYTKLSELYWILLDHPIYGKLIPVDTVTDGYYYTSNGIIYYNITEENSDELYVDPMVMYFTYFNSEKILQEQDTHEQEELQHQLQDEFDKQAQLQQSLEQ